MALHRQALGKDKEALVASSPHPGGTSELQLVFCAVHAAGQCPHVVLGGLQGSRGTGCRGLGTGGFNGAFLLQALFTVGINGYVLFAAGSGQFTECFSPPW